MAAAQTPQSPIPHEPYLTPNLGRVWGVTNVGREGACGIVEGVMVGGVGMAGSLTCAGALWRGLIMMQGRARRCADCDDSVAAVRLGGGPPHLLLREACWDVAAISSCIRFYFKCLNRQPPLPF